MPADPHLQATPRSGTSQPAQRADARSPGWGAPPDRVGWIVRRRASGTSGLLLGQQVASGEIHRHPEDPVLVVAGGKKSNHRRRACCGGWSYPISPSELTPPRVSYEPAGIVCGGRRRQSTSVLARGPGRSLTPGGPVGAATWTRSITLSESEVQGEHALGRQVEHWAGGTGLAGMAVPREGRAQSDRELTGRAAR